MKLQERGFLKEEMQELKSCQVKYFYISVTATGVLLNLGGEMGLPVFHYLSPLVIILPCWLIFFDKATSITRITGYSKYLEAFILSEPIDAEYVGWENALSISRKRQKNAQNKRIFDRLKSTISAALDGLVSILKFSFEYRYWKISWVVFFMLSATCFFLGMIEYFNKPDPIIFFLLCASLFFILLAACHTLYLLHNLIEGKFSYKENGKMWADCLKPRKTREYWDNEFEVK